MPLKINTLIKSAPVLLSLFFVTSIVKALCGQEAIQVPLKINTFVKSAPVLLSLYSVSLIVKALCGQEAIQVLLEMTALKSKTESKFK